MLANLFQRKFSRHLLSGLLETPIAKEPVKKVLLVTLFTFLVSCSSSEEIVEPQELIKYQSLSSFSNLWYKGSDDNYHYFQHRDKVSADYRVSREKFIWEEEKVYGELATYIVVWPGR